MISVSWPIMSFGWRKKIGVPCAPMRVGPRIRLPFSSNQLRGTVPSEWLSHTRQMKVVSLFSNQLSGTVPSEWLRHTPLM